MSADKKTIFVWSPFVSKVGTVQNVINSLNGINKYSMLNKLNKCFWRMG